MDADAGIRPITIAEANDFFADLNLFPNPARGRFALGCFQGDVLQAAAIVGSPISRDLDDGVTAEIRRLGAGKSAPRAALECLYQRCQRAWWTMGGDRVVIASWNVRTASDGTGWQSLGSDLVRGVYVRERTSDVVTSVGNIYAAEPPWA